MGWLNGSIIVCSIVEAAKKIIKEDKDREDFYKKIFFILVHCDCDALYKAENRDKIFKKVRREFEEDIISLLNSMEGDE